MILRDQQEFWLPQHYLAATLRQHTSALPLTQSSTGRELRHIRSSRQVFVLDLEFNPIRRDHAYPARKT